jgi:inorganic triphosphatase YgiF
MEIEAKFVVDAATLAALADLRALGPYELAATPHAEVQRNTYFDTADRRLSALRCGLRVRLVGERRVATLKRGGQVRDGVHERGEWEVELDAGDAPEQWPPSEARDQTLAVTGGAELLPVVLVRTTRRHLYARSRAGAWRS